MNNYVFVTYFDQNYLSRGLALISSIRKVGIESQIYVIALDTFSYNILLKLKFNNISIINYETVIEKFEDELNLLNSFENKNTAERYFTLTPFFISYVFNSVESNTKLIYLDADIYLYNNIIEELNTMKNYDVLLIPHLYEEEDKFKYFKYGIYEIGRAHV